MIWQDAVITLCEMVFVVTLLRMLFDPTTRVARANSVLTASVLFTMSLCFGQLGLWGAASAQTTCAALWALLAWRRAA